MAFQEVVPATKARQHFFDLLDRVARANGHFTVTKDGEPVAEVVNSEEWRSLLTTLEILSNPRHRRQLDRRLRDVRRGKVVTAKQVFPTRRA